MVQGLSINTNVGAMVALEQLNLTNKKLQNTQLRITTGLKVNGPKDDAATFQIATRLRKLSAVRSLMVTPPLTLPFPVVRPSQTYLSR